MQPLTCECGYIRELTEAEKNVSAVICPKCKRTIRKGETWLKSIGAMNMFEAVKYQGRETKYLEKRRMKDGY
ncbi:MAG TPA: hypothetical protein ENH35_02990 [Candidatus Moranbacteria bacterium]|nr:hypothetical protein [Candidatus Pacearchaeota archaeon]HDZ85484.1 hypothetical protein [Candidatus Moranbacteria bacterium]